METTPSIVQAPYMLQHLTDNTQRIPATLLPDDWDSNSVLLGLRRDVNGVLVLVSGITFLAAR
jgi:hypothetical protein